MNSFTESSEWTSSQSYLKTCIDLIDGLTSYPLHSSRVLWTHYVICCQLASVCQPQITVRVLAAMASFYTKVFKTERKFLLQLPHYLRYQNAERDFSPKIFIHETLVTKIKSVLFSN